MVKQRFVGICVAILLLGSLACSSKGPEHVVGDGFKSLSDTLRGRGGQVIQATADLDINQSTYGVMGSKKTVTGHEAIMLQFNKSYGFDLPEAEVEYSRMAYVKDFFLELQGRMFADGYEDVSFTFTYKGMASACEVAFETSDPAIGIDFTAEGWR